MVWDRDDWMAAALLIGIFIAGILALLWITGNSPQSEHTVYPFGMMGNDVLYGAFLDFLIG